MVASPNGKSGGALHGAQSPQTEDKLNARHVVYRFEPNLPLEQLRDVEGMQVRRSESRAPKPMVDRYAEQMRNGAIFPAIVVNENHELVDGNTRWAAAKRNKRTTIPAYVCENLTPLLARSLSVELNQAHGQSMEDEEIRAFAEDAADAGQKVDVHAFARMTGAKPRTITNWLTAYEFSQRAYRCGFSPEAIAPLGDTTRIALGNARLTTVFVDVTRLAIDARLKARDTKQIVQEANAASSEAESLQITETARDARAEEIATRAAGFGPVKRKSSGSAMFMAGLLKYEPDDLLDVSPERQLDTLSKLRVLHERLGLAIAQADSEWGLETEAGSQG